jgi:site-specific DNA recombinase
MPAVRAAVYARFSTDLQSDRSIEDQVALCRQWAERNGYLVTQIYEDRARSGTSVFGRDGLSRLLDDARAGRFKAIIVEALDRLSRDQEDLAGIHKRMSFAGISIQTVHEGVADALQIGVRGLVSTLMIEGLKHKIRRGMAGVLRDGRHPGGKAYGYRPVPGRRGALEIVPEEADVVRRIFTSYVGGKSPREIAAELNRDGVLPPRGAAWNASTITGSRSRGTGILRNELYAGTIVWNRLRMVRDPDTGRRVSRVNDAGEVQRHDVPELAIVGRELFERAQALRASRSADAGQGTFTRRPRRLLSGLLRCGHCGGGMSIQDTRNGKTRVRCSRAVESGTCSNRRTYVLERIERGVVEGLRPQVEDPELMAAYVEAYREERMRLSAAARRDRGKLERRLARAEAAIGRQIDLYSRDETMTFEQYKARKDPLEAERQLLLKQLAHVPPEPVIELHPQAVQSYRETMADLAERFGDLDPLADRETIGKFRSLIDHVVVRDTPTGGVEVEVIGSLTGLLGEPAGDWGGAMVAEARFNRSPHTILLGRFAA